MANLLDYIAWRGDLSFEASPFSEVDNLIFSMLTFIDFENIVPEEADGEPVKLSECLSRYMRLYPSGQYFGKIFPAEMDELFPSAAKSARFGDVGVTFYRSETDAEKCMQFAAVTFVLPDGTLFVAFRGTDDSLIGWKEDFNLSYIHPAPGQMMALEYLREIASAHPGKIITGGHSKGGHLAVYSAVFSPESVRERIICAYSNDGPGFVREVIESELFAEMKDRIRSFVPQASVIGMLLKHPDNYTVVQSSHPNKNGLLQHDPFSWKVIGPRFIHLKRLAREGLQNDLVIDRWLDNVSDEERQRFTNILFGIIESTGAKTLTDFSVDQVPKIATIIRAFSELDRDAKEGMISIIKRFAAAGKKPKN